MPPVASTQNLTPSKRTPWSDEEDSKLVELKQISPKLKWVDIAEALNNRRPPKQYRERWYDHLCVDGKRQKKLDWTDEEDLIIYDFLRKHGQKWSQLTTLLPGRSCNSIKNHWNSIYRSFLKTSNQERKYKSHKPHCTLFNELVKCPLHFSVSKPLKNISNLN